MRQTLSRGMVVAAAATGILSMYGTPAFADSDANAVAANSPGVASGNVVSVPVDVPVNVCGNSVDVVGALNPTFGNSCANVSADSPASHAAPHHPSSGGSHGHASPGHGLSGHDSGRHGSDHRGGLGDARAERDRQSGYGDSSGSYRPSAGHGHSGASAHGVAQGSPGVASGNVVSVPVDAPVNVCGNSVDVVGLLNPAFGNGCTVQEGPGGYGDDTPPTRPPYTPPTTPPGTPPPAEPPVVTPPAEPPTRPTPSTPRPARPPELARTGSDGMLAASAAGMGLLVGGAILYRRNRAASSR